MVNKRINIVVTLGGDRTNLGSMPLAAISDFRRHLLANADKFPKETLRKWERHDNTPDESRLMVFIHYSGRLLRALELRLNKAERMKKELERAANPRKAAFHACEEKAENLRKAISNRARVMKAVESGLPSIDSEIAELDAKLQRLEAELSAAAVVYASNKITAALREFLGMEAENRPSLDDMRELLIRQGKDALKLGKMCVKEAQRDYPAPALRMAFSSSGLPKDWLENPESLSLSEEERRLAGKAIEQLKKTDKQSGDAQTLLLQAIFKDTNSLKIMNRNLASFEGKRKNGAAAKEGDVAAEEFRDIRDFFSLCVACSQASHTIEASVLSARKNYFAALGEILNLRGELEAVEKDLAGHMERPLVLPDTAELEQRIGKLRQIIEETKAQSAHAARLLSEIGKKQLKRENPLQLTEPDADMAMPWKRQPPQTEISLQQKIAPVPDGGQHEEALERAIASFVARQEEHFGKFLKSNPHAKGDFLEAMGDLARLYLQNGGKLHYKALGNSRFAGNIRQENFGKSKEHSIVRVGIDSANFYRILIDVKIPGSPVIIFAGKKGETDWLFRNNGAGLPHCIDAAMKNGQARAFAPLLELAGWERGSYGNGAPGGSCH